MTICEPCKERKVQMDCKLTEKQLSFVAGRVVAKISTNVIRMHVHLLFLDKVKQG